ncbi:hypothetical protein BDZ89DRAFT_1105061 [Hymenopellis radicata]|nr:hypothetical protein BDZ89DRAFT_1105061 [Hymenopellis radicata]
MGPSLYYTGTLSQLRNMKIGGNLSATEFLTKHGGSSLLNDADTRKKEELARRVKEDATKFPQGIVVDGVEAPAPPKEQTEDDFFESWSKPSTPKPSNPDPASSVSSSSSAPKKSKLGLGASKTKPVDFAAAEKKALEEAERTKQLGYDRQREEGAEGGCGSADAQRAAAFPRLGFGAIPGTGAAAMAAAPAPAPKYDPNTVAEAQTRLQSFQGATSISSNAYFGREEEEALPARDDDGLAALESAARDAMQRLMDNPDVQNISDKIRTGALKLSDYLAQMSER